MWKTIRLIISDVLMFWAFKAAPRKSWQREDIGDFIIEYTSKHPLPKPN